MKKKLKKISLIIDGHLRNGLMRREGVSFLKK